MADVMQPHHFITQSGLLLTTVQMTDECAMKANQYLEEIRAIGSYVSQKDFTGEVKEKKCRHIVGRHRSLTN